MNVRKDIKVGTNRGRAILADCYYPFAHGPLPVVLFAHGFKGFKDWGHWHALGLAFARAGFFFVKFNFSHNGTTARQPAEFADLEAFGHNNYATELDDLRTVLDWLEKGQDSAVSAFADRQDINLVGHSRGGAIALIKAEEDPRVRRLITWAAVSQLDYAWGAEGFVAEWASKGVYHVENSRTGQQMPIYYQMYEDFLAQGERLSTQRAAAAFKRPWLIVHGTNDAPVSARAANALLSWSSVAEQHMVDGADHVFGGSHPFAARELPAYSVELLQRSVDFLRQN